MPPKGGGKGRSSPATGRKFCLSGPLGAGHAAEIARSAGCAIGWGEGRSRDNCSIQWGDLATLTFNREVLCTPRRGTQDMQAKLIVVGGDIGAAEIPLKLPATIGRSRDATLTLAHPLVSRQHCELFEQEGRLMVRDLGSRNGTFLDNERITEAEVRPGDLLTIGNTTFRAVFETDDEATAKTVRARETVRDDQATVLHVRRDRSDSAIPLSEEELFRESDLSDENLGVDSGHFRDLDVERRRPS